MYYVALRVLLFQPPYYHLRPHFCLIASLEFDLSCYVGFLSNFPLLISISGFTMKMMEIVVHYCNIKWSFVFY